MSAPGVAKGKCKGMGKGKAPGSIPEGGKGHKLPRTRLSAEKFTGVVSAWKGNYGWIKPAEEIEHEKAGAHGGGLFVSRDDLIDRQELDVGAPVEFHIWEDATGLGAEEVVQTGAAPPGAAAAAKGKSKGPAKGWNGAGAAKGPPSWGAGKSGGKDWGKDSWGWGPSKGPGAKGWGASPVAKGAPKGWAAPGAVKAMISSLGKALKGAADKGKAKGKGKQKMGGKGHLLPRTRISAEKFTGTVAAWKGKYGWITPAEEIQHEKAGKHQGGIFVSKDDLTDLQELTPGATVEFHIWEDASGLGAEEVVQH